VIQGRALTAAPSQLMQVRQKPNISLLFPVFGSKALHRIQDPIYVVLIASLQNAALCENSLM
jgi:hypothetical protein